MSLMPEVLQGGEAPTIMIEDERLPEAVESLGRRVLELGNLAGRGSSRGLEAPEHDLVATARIHIGILEPARVELAGIALERLSHQSTPFPEGFTVPR